FWTHFSSCAPMPDGWPKKNGSTHSSRVENSHAPTMNMASATRSTCTSTRRRDRALARWISRSGESTSSGAVIVVAIGWLSGRETVLSALIADEHLLSQVLPDLLVQLDEASVEANLADVARPR